MSRICSRGFSAPRKLQYVLKGVDKMPLVTLETQAEQLLRPEYLDPFHIQPSAAIRLRVMPISTTLPFLSYQARLLSLRSYL